MDAQLETNLLTGTPIRGQVTHDIELPTISAGKSIALIAFGMGVYLAYLYLVGFEKIIVHFTQVNVAIFSTGFLLALAGMLCYSMSWKKIADQLDYQVSTADMFLMYMSSIFVNNLIPSGSFSGETARIYFLDKIAGNSRIDMTSATVAATRIITAIPFIVGMSLGLTYLALCYHIPTWAMATCLIAMFVLISLGIIFVGVCFTDTWLWYITNLTIKHAEKLLHRKVDRELCLNIVSQFHQTMDLLSNQKHALVVSGLWAVAGWVLINLVAWVAFRSMGLEISLFIIFAVYAVVVVFQALPIILPGGVGLADIIMTALFSAVGVPMHDAAAATILTRLIQLWFLTLVGALSTAHLMRKVNHIGKKG